MSKKIAWFTPFKNDSTIGRYSLAAVEAIRRQGIDAIIFHAEDEDIYQTNLPCQHYSANDKDLYDSLKEYDFIVYNMGNYLAYHEQIYEVYKKIPGIMNIHDVVMHQFVAGYYLASKCDANAYIKKALTLYPGEQILSDSARYVVSPVWESDRVYDFPFFEPFVENAVGVICHSEYALKFVRKYYHGPGKILQFPYCGISDFDTSYGNASDGRVRVFSVCNVSNKLTHVLLESLGKNPKLKSKLDIRLIGEFGIEPYREKIENLVKKYNLKSCVTFTGRLSDDEFVKELCMCDVVVNLRNPPIEGASSALMEQLWAGKPVVVLDHGCYSEIPDNCVYKIDPSDMEKGLANALLKLSKDSKLRTSLGSRAYEFAHNRYDPTLYAEGFEDFINKLTFYQPIEHLIANVSVALQDMGVTAGGELPNVAAREICKVFQKGGVDK